MLYMSRETEKKISGTNMISRHMLKLYHVDEMYTFELCAVLLLGGAWGSIVVKALRY
jgi:hypothetical protein